jgi:pimeloyl-ACP methyl ester carboxylesterase
VEDYGIVDLAADVDGVATALGHDDYALAIHDWGAIVGWHVALLYPERVRAVAGLSVPYVRDPTWPAMCTQQHWGERFFYWVYIQEEGRAEAELEADVRDTLLRMYVGASGDRTTGRVGPLDKGSTLLAMSPPAPDTLPAWLTPDDLDYYVAQFEQSGFRGGLNYYRNIPRLLDLTPQLEGVKVKPTTTFMIGRRDGVRHFISPDGMEQRFADLRRVTWVEGAGHWLQLEATEQVNAELVSFLAEFR